MRRRGFVRQAVPVPGGLLRRRHPLLPLSPGNVERWIGVYVDDLLLPQLMPSGNVCRYSMGINVPEPSVLESVSRWDMGRCHRVVVPKFGMPQLLSCRNVGQRGRVDLAKPGVSLLVPCCYVGRSHRSYFSEPGLLLFLSRWNLGQYLAGQCSTDQQSQCCHNELRLSCV
jgi:hypothetical protein